MNIMCRYPCLIAACLFLLTTQIHSLASPDISDPTTKPPTAQKTPTEAKVHIKDFVITGQNIFSQEELLPLLADSKGKELSLSELNERAGRITRYFRSHGYMVATAYIPPQTRADGKVEIAVLVGTYDKIIINNDLLLAGSAVRRQLGGIKPGAYIERRPLERAVWLIGDLAGAEAKANLEPGSKVGTSNLVINVLPKGSYITGNNSLDNFGNRYTGRNEGGMSIAVNGLTRQGDLFSARGLVGSDLSSGTIAWDMPVAEGTRLTLSSSKLSYTLGGQFAALGSNGTAKVNGIGWNYSMLRSGAANTNLTASFSNKEIFEHASAGSESNKHSNVLVFGFNSNTQDSRLGGGINACSLTYTRGKLGIETPLALLVDASSARTNGNFGKWNWSFMRHQAAGRGQSLLFSLNGQHASKNLDSSEKMSLGGAYGVRSYPQGEAAGDNGWLASLEFRKALPELKSLPGSLQATAFVDEGSVRLSKDNYTAGANYRKLGGFGLGLLYSSKSPRSVNCRLNYAWKLGPEKSVSDTDKAGRLWLQLAREF